MFQALTMLTAAMIASGGGSGRTVTDTFSNEFGSRRYDVYVPDAYDGTRALPVIVMLHGCTQDAADIARGTRLNAAADARGLLIVYPEQPAAVHPRTCWTWYDAAHQARERGEPSLIAGITRAVLSRYRADTTRVYLAGISAGGAMAAIVAAVYPELYAAIGVHSGVPVGAATTVMQALDVMRSGPAEGGALPALASRAPAFIAHGAKDAVVSPANGERLARQWATALGVESEVQGGGPDGVTARRWVRDGVVLIEWWLLDEISHAWSGGSGEGTFTAPGGPDVTEAMVRFFLARSRQAAG